MKRVVVTGMGAVTPVGNSTEEFWNSLVNGVNGIAKIESFDVSAFKHTMAAQLKNFDPMLLIDKMTVRKTDPFVQYALYASQQAIDDSGILEHIDHEQLGVYYGSGIGGFETFCNEHQALLEKGPRKALPLSARHTVRFATAMLPQLSQAAPRRLSLRLLWQASVTAWLFLRPMTRIQRRCRLISAEAAL